MSKWIYWKEQCKYCVNNNPCNYPENKEAMESLIKWEKENRFYGGLKLMCDYFYLDEDKYYEDHPPVCCGQEGVKE